MIPKVHVAIAMTCAALVVPALAGTDPVVPIPSPPIVIGPTVIDTQAVETLFSTTASTTPEVQQAIAELADAPPGSVEAMTAVDWLAGEVATSFNTDGASFPALGPLEASQAISIIDGLINALADAGVPTSGLEALKATIQNRARQAG